MYTYGYAYTNTQIKNLNSIANNLLNFKTTKLIT